MSKIISYTLFLLMCVAIIFQNNSAVGENIPFVLKDQLLIYMPQSISNKNINIFKYLNPYIYWKSSPILSKTIDFALISWIKSNISPKSGLFYSFQVLKDEKKSVYSVMGDTNSVPAIIERTIVENGLVIYDGAVAQIALTLVGGKDEMHLAQKPLDVYWKGTLGSLTNIRAGYPNNNFIYDPEKPDQVSSNLEAKGKRGFIFRIINANGDYLSTDPLDGKRYIEGFPTWPEIHWEDWKPVAGENAWVVMAAMHVLHQKHYNLSTDSYDQYIDSVEFQLAEELARAAIILQTDNGGIRMAPIGTFRENESSASSSTGSWWYNQISTENTLSWYGAFRMLYRVTGNKQYLLAMKKMDNYFQLVYDKSHQCLHQGMSYKNGAWTLNQSDFAVDVQTWGILSLGPETVDRWFGDGASYSLWLKTKALSATYDDKNRLIGVGYTSEKGRVSVEWTAGAIMAVREMSQYYKTTHSLWAQELVREAQDMRQGMELLRRDLSSGLSAYAYSSQRGIIPFGWNSHDPRVLSLASTGWIIFVDQQYNPFFIDGNIVQIKHKLITQNTVQTTKYCSD